MSLNKQFKITTNMRRLLINIGKAGKLKEKLHQRSNFRLLAFLLLF